MAMAIAAAGCIRGSQHDPTTQGLVWGVPKEHLKNCLGYAYPFIMQDRNWVSTIVEFVYHAAPDYSGRNPKGFCWKGQAKSVVAVQCIISEPSWWQHRQTQLRRSIRYIDSPSHFMDFTRTVILRENVVLPSASDPLCPQLRAVTPAPAGVWADMDDDDDECEGVWTSHLRQSMLICRPC